MNVKEVRIYAIFVLLLHFNKALLRFWYNGI